jgi:hypothetical protein
MSYWASNYAYLEVMRMTDLINKRDPSSIAKMPTTDELCSQLAKATKIIDAQRRAIDELRDCLIWMVNHIEYKTPHGANNCRYCDNNMDHEGTYREMHAKDCPIHAARLAIAKATE